MPSLADQMLASGAAVQVAALHGERVKVLSGADAGKFFTAVRETEADLVLTTELGQDPRQKIMMRFITAPNLSSQDILRTDDGRKWHVVRDPQDTYLTNDFELIEIVAGKDS
jgi:hypothetical protein